MYRSALLFSLMFVAPIAVQPLTAQQPQTEEPVEIEIVKGSPGEDYAVLDRFELRSGTGQVSDLLNRARRRAEVLGAATLFYELVAISGPSPQRRFTHLRGLPAVSGRVGTCQSICSTAASTAAYHYRAWRAYRRQRTPVSISAVQLRGWAVVERDQG